MYFIKLKKNHHMFRFYKESHVKILMFGQGRKKIDQGNCWNDKISKYELIIEA